jgi:threonine/homoserine/homoserine lactone efflux protein
MFGTHDLWLFAATVFIVNATPGVDMLLTLTRTLQFGACAGAAAALGIATGCVLHTLAAAFGLAALLAASSAAFDVVRYAGAAYLLWLAWGMLRAALANPSSRRTPGSTVSAAADSAQGIPAFAGMTDCAVQRESPPPPRLASHFRQGLLTNALNPKVALFFLALLPQFIDAAAPSKTAGFVFLGAWFIVQGGAFLLLFVASVAPLLRWQAPPALARTLNACGAALFATLAARLALTQRT